MNIPALGDMKKFSFAEMTSNNTGKTSGSGVLGLYAGFIGGLMLITGTIDKMFISKTTDILSYGLYALGFGSSLLGARHYINNKFGPKEMANDPADDAGDGNANTDNQQH